MSKKRRLRVAASAGALAVSLFAASAMFPAEAETVTIGFETFAAGSPDGQFGWEANGSAGSGCALYDHAIVVNVGAPASFGTQSLRMSNGRDQRLLRRSDVL
jgi:hypothetical protein